MEIMTCDKEWSHQELYGVAYDECIKACRNIGFLLDDMSLTHPNNLVNLIMDELGDKNLVDIYDEFYAEATDEHKSDEAMARWDKWLHERIKSTLQAHKYKYYTK